MKKSRFVLVNSDDGDDYYVPSEKYSEWYQLHSDDPFRCEYAKRIIGKFTFTDPKVD